MKNTATEKLPSQLPRGRMIRLVLRLWHSIWIAYWRERLDDPVTFTDSSGISKSQRKHAAHVWAWRDTF